MSLLQKPTAADITTEWTDMVREMVVKDKAKLRLHATRNSVEVYSAATGGWHTLTLQGDATELATPQDAGDVLRRILP